MATVSNHSVTALILAGDRTDDDPVRLAAGSNCKALAEVAGRPMLLRVLDVLLAVGPVQKFILCGPPRHAVEYSPELQDFLDRDNADYLENQASLSGSVSAGLQHSSIEEKVLLTTADNALLDTEIIEDFLQSCIASNADFCIGMVDYQLIKQQYPQVKRTVLKFRDKQYCGCNLYFVNTAAGRGVIDHWQAIQQDRKKPWLMVSKLFGLFTLLRYLLGTLSVAAACRAIGSKTGLQIAIVDVPHAHAGIDVDTAADLELVEKILQMK